MVGVLAGISVSLLGVAVTLQLVLSSEWIARNVWIVWLAWIATAVSFLATFIASRRLTIHLAEWGPGRSDGDYQPVTTTVRGYMNPKRTAIEMRAADHVLGDPYVGLPKHLRVRYSRGLKRNAVITVAHNDWLRIP